MKSGKCWVQVRCYAHNQSLMPGRNFSMSQILAGRASQVKHDPFQEYQKHVTIYTIKDSRRARLSTYLRRY